MDSCGFLNRSFDVKRGQYDFIGSLFSHRSHSVCRENFFKPILCRLWRTAFNSCFHNNPRLCGRKRGFLWCCAAIMGFNACKCNMDRQVSFPGNDIPMAHTHIRWCFSIPVPLFIELAMAKKNPLSLKELLFHLIEKYPHLEKRFAHAKLNGKIEASRLPYYTGAFRIAGDNYMLLGDAARLIDPFTGEGVGNAMASGFMAAEISARCLEKNDFSYNCTRNYEMDVYTKLGPDLATGLKLQGLAGRKALLNLVIGKASRHEKTRDMISEMLYDTNAKRKLSKSLFYLKLLLGR